VGGGDAYVMPVAIGLTFGRIGCLLKGCCWGAGGVPVPGFEIAFHLAAFFVFLQFRRRRVLVGSWFPIYLLAYCVFRFAMEFIRTEPRIWFGLTVYHGIALAGMGIFSAELAYRGKLKGTASHDRRVSD
jgi:prolipoprotein diacylglyceryltransferase